MMLAELAQVRVFERSVERVVTLPGGVDVSVALTVRLETPGECCADIASTLAFAYDPSLPDDVAVRLDDRLYDGIYAGLAEAPGALPPGRLKVAITEFRSEPPLADLVSPPDWGRIGALGEALGALSAEAFLAVWDEMRQRMP
jgi:hypothetical protein